MNGKRTIHRRVDERAIITMIVVSVVALVVMAYRFVNYAPCPSFAFSSKARHYYTGEAIRFESNIRAFSSLKWDFGDNQTNDTKIPSAVHAYNEPGEYVVTLTANGECKEYNVIVISPAPRVDNPKMTPTFVCPQSAEVGKPVQFSDTTAGARRWEWRFGETATVDATDRSPRYTYTTPGLKTVSVVINDDEQQMGVCKIYVNPPAPKPGQRRQSYSGAGFIPSPARDHGGKDSAAVPPPAKEKVETVVKAPAVSGPEIESLLRGVANKFKTAQDFAPYLCGNMNVQVSLNGQMVPFSDLCNKLASLKSEKKIKKLNVQLVKDDKTGCILAMFVTLKEKEGLFNKIF